MKQLWSLFISLVFLTACGSTSTKINSAYPVPIVKPGYDSAPAKTTVTFDAKSIEEIKENLYVYSKLYESASSDLKKQDYTSSHVSMAGALIGIAGGLLESAGTAAAGAILGAGPSVAANYFQFAVQSNNYHNASKAMFCLRSKLLFVPDTIETILPDLVESSAVNFSNQVTSVTQLTNLEQTSYKELIQHANLSIEKINNRLGELQRTVNFSSPDLSDLEKAVADYLKLQPERESSQQSFSSLEAAIISNINQGQKLASDIDETYMLARARMIVLDYKSVAAELDKCVAAFSQ